MERETGTAGKVNDTKQSFPTDPAVLLLWRYREEGAAPVKTNTDSGMRVVTLSAKRRLWDLRLREVWDYRDLILLFTKRTFLLTYKQTILGPIWLLLNPILTSGVYTLVFGRVAGIGTAGVPMLLFYLCGTAVWNYFSVCVTVNAQTFLANAALFGKVYFPRLTVPISAVLAGAIRFLIQMGLSAAFLVYYCAVGQMRFRPLALLVLPLTILQLGVMGMSVGILVSSLTTRYRDLSVLVSFGMNLWMFGTPIVYPFSQLPEGALRIASMLNPVTPPAELFRIALLGAGDFMPGPYLWSWVFTLLVAVVGVVVFNKVEQTFQDTV